MKDFVNKRKVSVKGRTIIEVEIVWESLRLRMEKNSDSRGNAAASKREWSLDWMEKESGRRVVERRIVVENGSAKKAIVEK